MRRNISMSWKVTRTYSSRYVSQSLYITQKQYFSTQTLNNEIANSQYIQAEQAQLLAIYPSIAYFEDTVQSAKPSYHHSTTTALSHYKTSTHFTAMQASIPLYLPKDDFRAILQDAHSQVTSFTKQLSIIWTETGNSHIRTRYKKFYGPLNQMLKVLPLQHATEDDWYRMTQLSHSAPFTTKKTAVPFVQPHSFFNNFLENYKEHTSTLPQAYSHTINHMVRLHHSYIQALKSLEASPQSPHQTAEIEHAKFYLRANLAHMDYGISRFKDQFPREACCFSISALTAQAKPYLGEDFITQLSEVNIHNYGPANRAWQQDLALGASLIYHTLAPASKSDIAIQNNSRNSLAK